MFGLDINIISKYKDNKMFYNIFCLINTLLIFIFYAIDRQYVMYYIFLGATISLVLTNQIKYILPYMIMFTMSMSASITNLPLTISLLGLFILSVIGYFIYNRPKIKIKKHGLMIILFAISTFIPIFWYKEIENLHEVYIITYSFYFVFFLTYLIFKSSKESLLKPLIIVVSYIPLLLMLELVFYFITVPNTNFQGGIFLGWAGGNHASMMILFSFPFVMYRFYTEKKLIPLFLIICSILSIIFGFSRAGYLFFIIELIIFFIYTLYYYRDKPTLFKIRKAMSRNYLTTITIVSTICVLLLITVLSIPNMKEMLQKVLDDNGRFDVYLKGLEQLTLNFRNFILGRGFVSDYILYDGVFLLYHNTFIQALVTGGIIMFILMIIHFIQKYLFFKHKRNLFMTCLLIGFIITDLYGITDTTYFSAYFTIVFTCISVCFEDNEEEILKLI
ncbi:MAG: hypothetical protein R3Y60_05475 [bacterium]